MDEIDIGDLFPEPLRPQTPPSTVEIYTRNDVGEDRGPKDIKIHLVGQHPLWGHHLWNASKTFASYLDTHWTELCRDKRVLELGAGGGLPGLVAALNQANSVVLTDYPDPELIRNLEKNAKENLLGAAIEKTTVEGFIWGASATDLLRNGPFDIIILSDLLFNHSQHDALLRTCDQTLAHTAPALVLVFYTHHRPWLAEKDMEFFEKARNAGWECEQVVQAYTGAMFADDRGDEKIRGTVHGWRMWRSLFGKAPDRKSVV